MTYHTRTREAAKGKWRGILLELGLPSAALVNRHGPCPMCGGKDRFRYDNADGNGTWFCNACGAGDGIALAMQFTGQDFGKVASKIDSLLGNQRFEPDVPKPQMTAEEVSAKRRAIWAATRPMQRGDLVDTYLATRRLDERQYPADLRFAPRLMDNQGGVWPAMVAMVRGGDGKPATLHQTFLRPDGKGKADIPGSPRQFAPGSIHDGAAVRVTGWIGGVLGIAEGIETAMAAANRFELPCWAALNSGLLEKWWPPEGCVEVAIFGDNDRKFGGQAAAYRLAHRLTLKGLSVTVHIPPTLGEDWADVWKAGR